MDPKVSPVAEVAGPGVIVLVGGVVIAEEFVGVITIGGVEFDEGIGTVGGTDAVLPVCA